VQERDDKESVVFDLKDEVVRFLEPETDIGLAQITSTVACVRPLLKMVCAALEGVRHNVGCPTGSAIKG
jgi:hypothetical protein